MLNRSLPADQDSLESIIARVYESFRKGLFSEAEKLLEKGIKIDFEDGDVIAGLKCARFWIERSVRIDSYESDQLALSEYLYKEWKVFKKFILRLNQPFEQGIYAIKVWIFQVALSGYLKSFQADMFSDDELLLRIGRCYKEIGNYDKAREYLENASRKRRDDAEILAELADVYAFINETKIAKAFFREAFYINPEKVDIDFLESGLITRLIERIVEIGYSDSLLKEWIPVYGVLWSVFNVKRELKPLEFGKLKQSIFSIENRIKETESEEEIKILIPRLLNRYFWLIDHYIITKDSREKIEEILRKIHAVDESVYEHYIN